MTGAELRSPGQDHRSDRDAADLLRGYRIARWEAAVFLGYHIAYVGYLILASANHGLATRRGDATTWFVLPLTVLTIGISVIHQRRGSPTPAR